jgi:site-specific recombinase XerD
MALHPGQQGSLYDLNGCRKYLTPAERNRFLDAANACECTKLRTFCLTLAYSGCRISEGLALMPVSIERADGFIAVQSLKKRSRTIVVRQVPVPDDLLAMIEEVHCADSDFRHARLWPWSRGYAWLLVKAVMAQAGITDGIHATPKGLRHGFGLHAIRSGVPLNLVQRWLGHASMTTTAIYLQAIGSEEREIAARMWH